VLEATDRLMKNKYVQPSLDQWRHFTPFVVSVDGLVSKEARTVIKALVENRELTYSRQGSRIHTVVHSVTTCSYTHLLLNIFLQPSDKHLQQ
jgi:hypothetical protein